MIHLSGTNPLLLAALRANDSESTFASTLKTYVKGNLTRNLHGLVSNVMTVEDYLLHNEMLQCIPIVKLANRGHTLTKQEKRAYEESWLWKHFVAVLEDSKDQEAVAGVGNSDTNQVLLWNFPVLADIFIDVLENFVTQSTEADLVQCCTQTPSFAGYWYEHLFFKHYGGSKSITFQVHNDLHLTFAISRVIPLSIVQDEELQSGVIYQMKANFPVIDAVGLFDHPKSH